MGITRKIRALVLELGPWTTVLYLFSRALEKSGGFGEIRHYALVAQPVRSTPMLPARRGAKIGVQEVGPEDPALGAMPLTPRVLAYRFNQGAVCFGAFLEGRMIGCLWLVLGPYEEDEVRCRFCPEAGAAWDFDVYIRPEFRTGLAFARLWDSANAFLRDRSIAWSCSRISLFNPASLASHGKLAARRIGTATFLRLSRCQIMVATVPPYLHLSIGPKSLPVVRLGAERGRAIA